MNEFMAVFEDHYCVYSLRILAFTFGLPQNTQWNSKSHFEGCLVQNSFSINMLMAHSTHLEDQKFKEIPVEALLRDFNSHIHITTILYFSSLCNVSVVIELQL